MKKTTWLVLLAGLLIGTVIFYIVVKKPTNLKRIMNVTSWLRDPDSHPELAMKAGKRCNDSPFIFPTDGFIGFLWDDSFRPGHHHQGIDVFGGRQAGITPVYTVYDGYLTRQSDWKSTVIVRIPADPLQPERQIWTYYTHMADSRGNSFIVDEFPPGTSEVYVPAGTHVGYQGDYSGTPDNPVGVHLHFSIVKDDGSGKYLNELKIGNTLDPSLYFGLELNAKSGQTGTSLCP